MSFSLQIENGDLALGGSSLATVEGARKVVQDLSCAILTPLGTYHAHPEFGSALDGGQTPEGYNPGVIGETNWSKAGMAVQAEIRRITSDYQAQQIARNASDAAIYGKSTLSSDEVLLDVQNISLQQAQDNLLVSIILNTGTGPIQANVPIAERA